MNFAGLKSNLHIGRRWWYVILFLTVLSYFLWLNATATFSDPDAFYHAKIAQLIKESGLVKEFSWLPMTTLNEIYIDHHWLYHLLIVPGLYFLNPLIAVKLAAALFAALAIVSFEWLLDKLRVKYSLAYTLLLLAAYQFVFRINLVKTSALSLICLLGFIYLLFNHHGRWSWKLFGLSGVYVWLYGGWVISLGVGLIYWLVKGVLDWYQYHLKQQKTESKYFWSSLLKRPQLKLLANFTGGILAGLLINPYFPTNLKFYWQQSVQIGLVNYKEIVDVGSEWYGIALFDLVRHNVLIFILWLIAVLIFFARLKQQTARTWTLLIVNFIFLGLTLKAKRNFEYLIPLVVLFSALVISRAGEVNPLKVLQQWGPKYLPYYPKIVYILALGLLTYLPILWQGNFKGLPEALGYRYRFDQLAKASQWLKGHTQPGAIIFHDRWDDWPVFFYHNSYNRYIIGLDPRFMYFKDKNKYELWHKIVKGELEQPCRSIKQNFQSNYVFVKNDNLKFRYNLTVDKACQLAYQDEDGQIYKIINF